MKIVVLNGSPKGNMSVTMHTALYIEQKFKEHEWKHFNVGNKLEDLKRIWMR